MAKFAGLRDPVTLDFEGSTAAYCVDALTITVGSLLGTSPVTAFIESATGIAGMYCSTLHFHPSVRLIWSTSRGRKDGHNGRRDRLDVPRISLLCPDLCFHPIVGHWRSPRNCRFPDDQKVCGPLASRRECEYGVLIDVSFFLHPLASVRSIGTILGTLPLHF